MDATLIEPSPWQTVPSLPKLNVLIPLGQPVPE
jgi:hypothetical protein